MVRVAGYDRSSSLILVAGKVGPPSGREEPGISLESHGSLRTRCRGCSHRAWHPRSLGGSHPSSTPALPCTVLHGAGGYWWWVVGTVCIAAPHLALAGFISPPQFRNVFCAATTLPCERSHRVAMGATAQSMGTGI